MKDNWFVSIPIFCYYAYYEINYFANHFDVTRIAVGGLDPMDWSALIVGLMGATAAIISAWISSRATRKKTAEDIGKTIADSVKKTEAWVGDPKTGVLADTSKIIDATNRIDENVEKLTQTIPTDIKVLAESTRASVDALKKSKKEQRSSEMILADVKRALLEKQVADDRIRELEMELKETKEKLEKAEKERDEYKGEIKKLKKMARGDEVER